MVRISVCLAAFNGEKYIKKQLDSILPQLSENDEIVISDDSSSDNTVAIIKDLNDKRIKLLENNFFQSPIYNFENSISHATGNIIFLADQDDLWLDHKLSTTLRIFVHKPSVTLVASDANIIDRDGKLVFNSFYSERLKFNSGVIRNLIKNRYLGCTLAFRKNMIDYLLPFPPDIPMHDVWIGIINKIYGEVYFIDSPLISYRRHENNFSPSSRSAVRQIIVWRWNLASQVIKRMVKVAADHLRQNETY